jgi:hypothetical protein
MSFDIGDPSRSAPAFVIDGAKVLARCRQSLVEGKYDQRLPTKARFSFTQSAPSLAEGARAAVQLLDATLHVREPRRRALVAFLCSTPFIPRPRAPLVRDASLFGRVVCSHSGQSQDFLAPC